MAEKYTTVKKWNLHGLVSLQTLFSLFGLSGFIDVSGKRIWPTEHNTEWICKRRQHCEKQKAGIVINPQVNPVATENAFAIYW